MITERRARELSQHWADAQGSYMLRPYTVRVHGYSRDQGSRLVQIVAYIREHEYGAPCIELVQLVVFDDEHIEILKDLRRSASRHLAHKRYEVITAEDRNKLDPADAEHKLLTALASTRDKPWWFVTVHAYEDGIFVEMILESGDCIFIPVDVFTSNRERSDTRRNALPHTFRARVSIVITSHPEHSSPKIASRFLERLEFVRSKLQDAPVVAV